MEVLTNGRTGMLEPQPQPQPMIPKTIFQILVSCSGNFLIMDLDKLSN